MAKADQLWTLYNPVGFAVCNTCGVDRKQRELIIVPLYFIRLINQTQHNGRQKAVKLHQKQASWYDVWCGIGCVDHYFQTNFLEQQADKYTKFISNCQRRNLTTNPRSHAEANHVETNAKAHYAETNAKANNLTDFLGSECGFGTIYFANTSAHCCPSENACVFTNVLTSNRMHQRFQFHYLMFFARLQSSIRIVKYR